jgi:poly(hydroxyalkanoate) depolymerase family esterase
MNDMMLEAARLTRTNRLAEATALIQRTLRGTFHDGSLPASSRQPFTPPAGKAWSLTRLDVETQFGWTNLTDRFQAYEFLADRRRTGRFAATDLVPEGATFIERQYANSAGSRRYKLYIPAGYMGQKLPLIVMLHGGTQTADDFAGGTRMNVRADEQKCLVAYPEQPVQANLSKCWNWFRPEDQCRDQGEPSLVAGITEQVIKDYSVDRERVYVAGFSAGGAAAAVLGAAYPDLYVAIGVHSGLAYGAAEDMLSALAAMRQARPLRQATTGTWRMGQEPVPTIVFHGDNDPIVHPTNSEGVGGAAKESALRKEVRSGQVTGGHAYTCTHYLGANEKIIAEDWKIHGAGHAWSGGHPAGSYTDEKGPDAAREMLRFFRSHVRVAADS